MKNVSIHLNIFTILQWNFNDCGISKVSIRVFTTYTTTTTIFYVRCCALLKLIRSHKFVVTNLRLSASWISFTPANFFWQRYLSDICIWCDTLFFFHLLKTYSVPFWHRDSWYSYINVYIRPVTRKNWTRLQCFDNVVRQPLNLNIFFSRSKL